MNLDSEFNDFIEKIRLNNTQQERIDSAVSAISSYIKDYFEIEEQDVFLQGSVATETVTKPKDSTVEYDVDLVAIIGNSNSTPSGLLENTLKCFEEHGTYKDKINDDGERPCIRLQYADEGSAKFHVDVVPARVGTSAPLEIPTRNLDWKETAPREFVQWSLDHSDEYRKAVMIFKRWRDSQEVPVASIILQVLVADVMDNNSYGSFTGLIAECFSTIQDRFSGADSSPTLPNPVLNTEDLASKWDEEDFTIFKDRLTEAVENVNTAISETDKEAAVALWQKVLGDDFIATIDDSTSLVLSTQQLTLSLGDTSHAEIAPWSMSTQQFNATINATATWKTEKKVFKPRARNNRWQVMSLTLKTKVNPGQVVHKGLTLDYFVSTNVPKPYKVYWQVVNTGVEAQNDLRGQIQERTGHHIEERTKYAGTHWVEAFIVRDDICLAQTGRFYINIPQ